MATDAQLEQLAGRLVMDPAFRTQFFANPATAAQGVGITLTPDQQTSFLNNVEAFAAAAEQLEASGNAATPDADGHAVAVMRQ